MNHLKYRLVFSETGYLTIKSTILKKGCMNSDFRIEKWRKSLTDGLLNAYRNVSPGNDSMVVTDDFSERSTNNGIS
jgi:hypothetical protein